MKISDQDIRNIAELARLGLEENEVAGLRSDLEAILGYVNLLDAVDTEGVEPTAHVLDIPTPMRADEVSGVLPVSEVVRNAPEHDERSMLVPKVLE